MEIHIEGIDKLFAKLDRAQALETLRAPMQRSLYRLQRDMADYPLVPPASNYQRTGTLGRRWTTSQPQINRTMDGLQGRIGNVTEYAPFVQSRQFQRPVFRRIGWQTDEQVLERNLDDIQRDFEQAIRDALK